DTTNDPSGSGHEFSLFLKKRKERRSHRGNEVVGVGFCEVPPPPYVGGYKRDQPAALPAGKISLNAARKRSISSGVPMETRRCSSMGGNGRPTSTPRERKSWIAARTGRRMCTITKFPCEGMTV